jgi:hypothetical protein
VTIVRSGELSFEVGTTPGTNDNGVAIWGEGRSGEPLGKAFGTGERFANVVHWEDGNVGHDEGILAGLGGGCLSWFATDYADIAIKQDFLVSEKRFFSLQ